METQGEGHLDSVLESSDGIVVVLDGNGKVLRLSKGARKALGYEESDVVGLTIVSMVPADRREWTAAIYKRVRDDKLVSEVFIHWKTKDGRRLISKSNLKAVVNYQSEVVGTIISEDMTAPREGTGSMTPEQAMELIHASEISMIVTDLSGNIVSVSTGAEKLTGFQQAQVIGTSIARLFHSREIVGELTTRTLRDGKVEDKDALIVTPQDERKQVSVSVSVRRNPSGAAMGFSFVIFDIAARKDLEKELELRADKLRLVNELSTKIRSGKSLKEIHSAALEGLQRLVRFDTMTIVLASMTEDAIRPTSIEGSRPDWISENALFPADKGPFADAMKREAPVIYTPTELRAISIDLGDSRPSFQTGAVIPLYAGDRALGFLNFTSMKHSAFDDKDLDTMYLVADHIALAAESSRLFSALMENINIQTVLMETSTAVRSEMNLKEAYPLAVAKAQEVVSSNHAALYMLDGERLSLVASDGTKADNFPREIDKSSKSLIAAQFFGNGKSFIREAAKNEGAADWERAAYSSVMMTRLVSRSGPMGVLYVARGPAGTPFTPYEFELFSLYSNHLSPALENAKLFEETRQSEEKTRKALESERRTREALHFMVEMFAHDSQNQIQGISGYLDLMANSDIPAEVQSYLEKAMRQVKAGSYLISGTALVFKNIDGEKKPRRFEEMVWALQDSSERFSMVFPGTELELFLPALERKDDQVDQLLSELFFHVMRLMSKVSTAPGIEIRAQGEHGKTFIEFRTEATSSSKFILDSLEPGKTNQERAATWLIDPFIVRILSESYGARIATSETPSDEPDKRVIVCTLEFA